MRDLRHLAEANYRHLYYYDESRFCLVSNVPRAWQAPGVLFDLATAHLVAQRVVLPGVSLLARLIARVRERTGRALYRQVQARLSGAQRDRLDALLVASPGERLTPLEVLRTPPTRVSAPALVAALRRLDQIRAVGVGAVPVQDLPEARLARLARHAQFDNARIHHAAARRWPATGRRPSSLWIRPAITSPPTSPSGLPR